MEGITLLPHNKKEDAVIISKGAARLSGVLSGMLDDGEDVYPLPNISKEILEDIVKFCEYHADNPIGEVSKPLTSSKLESLISEWDFKFINGRTHQYVFNLVNSAEYLQIKSLIMLCCVYIATFIRNHTDEEIALAYSTPEKPIKVPTAEEFEAYKKTHKWIFDPVNNTEPSEETKNANFEKMFPAPKEEPRKLMKGDTKGEEEES
jgi:S-phase kinase-associated protein 1